MEYIRITLALFLSICIAGVNSGALDGFLQPKEKKGQCDYCAKEGSRPAFGMNGKEYKNECYRKCTEGNLPSFKMKTSTYSDSDEGFSSEDFSSEERPRRRKRPQKPRKNLNKKNRGATKQPKKSIQFHTDYQPPTGESGSLIKPTVNTIPIPGSENYQLNNGKNNSVEDSKSQGASLQTSALKLPAEMDKGTNSKANDDATPKISPPAQGPLLATPNFLQDAFGQSSILSNWNPFGELASIG